MEQINLEAETRPMGPDSILSSLRKNGSIPGILYGHDMPNKMIQLDYRDFNQQIKKHGKSGIFHITIDNEQIPVKINEIQFDQLENKIIHVDLQRIEMNKAVDMVVPIHFFGEALGVKKGGAIHQQIREIQVRGLPSTLPELIKLNVSDLNIGDTIFIKDIELTEDIQILHDPNTIILTIIPPRRDEDEIAEKLPESEPEIVGARDGHGIDAAR